MQRQKEEMKSLREKGEKMGNSRKLFKIQIFRIVILPKWVLGDFKTSTFKKLCEDFFFYFLMSVSLQFI